MGDHGYVKVDPAIERWNDMRESVHKGFRFTPRTAWVALFGVVLIPGAIYYAARASDTKWSFAGKLKTESLRTAAPEEA